MIPYFPIALLHIEIGLRFLFRNTQNTNCDNRFIDKLILDYEPTRMPNLVQKVLSYNIIDRVP